MSESIQTEKCVQYITVFCGFGCDWVRGGRRSLTYSGGGGGVSGEEVMDGGRGGEGKPELWPRKSLRA